MSAPFVIELTMKASIILGAGLLVAIRMRLPADVKHTALLVALGSALLCPPALFLLPTWSVAILPSAKFTSRLNPSTGPAQNVPAATVTTVAVSQVAAAAQRIETDQETSTTGATEPLPTNAPRAVMLTWCLGACGVLSSLAR